MDINFHYFAVKTLAHFAGFPDHEAQRIAEFSQYIDDYNWYAYINSSNIPEYAKYEEYDLVVNVPLFGEQFNPAQTGFTDWFDYAILAIERNQKFIVSPFHFVPFNKYKANKHNRTTPGTPRDGSMIDNFLWTIIYDYTERCQQRVDTSIALMRLGMVLHTFADTYAHQLFSGYNSWVNEVKVTQVINNINNANITAQVQEEINEIACSKNNGDDRTSIAPPIGHARAGHTPDLTNISFTMKYKSKKGGGYDQVYSRSNTETFVDACRHIYNYLGKCFYRPDISDDTWEPLKKRLTQAFLVEMPKKDVEETLAEHWRTVFPEVKTYYYNKEIIENRFEDIKTNAYTDEFYRYNCMADRVLIELYDWHPRRVFGVSGKEVLEKPI